MKLAWKLLVGLGVLLVFISLGMDTTVSTGMGRVHNIGLQGQQQMFLILGCFLFLGGIVLFAVFKIKQTPEQEAAEEKERQAAMDVTKIRVEELSTKADEIGKVLSKVRAGTDNLPARLCAGVVIGVMWATYCGELSRSSGAAATLFFVALMYSLWPSSWRAVVIRLLTANLVFLVLAFINVATKISFSEVLSQTEGIGALTLFFVLPTLVSVGLIMFLRRKQK